HGIGAGQRHTIAVGRLVLVTELLEPVRRVHRVADHGVVDAAGRAAIPDHGRAGMDANAHAQDRLAQHRAPRIVGRHRDADRLYRGAGMLGVVLVTLDRAP